MLVDSNLVIYAASGNYPKLLVAATALHYNLPLATHNTKDFTWIKSLSLIGSDRALEVIVKYALDDRYNSLEYEAYRANFDPQYYLQQVLIHSGKPQDL